MIVYWIVTSAVESSKLANEVNELKQLVQQLVNDKKLAASDGQLLTVQNQAELEKCASCKSVLVCTDCDLSVGKV